MGESSVTYGLCAGQRPVTALKQEPDQLRTAPLPLAIRRRVPGHKTPSHDHAGQVSRRFEVALLVCPA